MIVSLGNDCLAQFDLVQFTISLFCIFYKRYVYCLAISDDNHRLLYDVTTHQTNRELTIIYFICNVVDDVLSTRCCDITTMSLEQYNKIKVIGKGSYGEVWLAKHKRDKKQVELKLSTRLSTCPIGEDCIG